MLKLQTNIVASVIITAFIVGGGTYLYVTKNQLPLSGTTNKEVLQEARSHNVEITYNIQKGVAIITNDGIVVGEIPVSSQEQVSIRNQTQHYAYLEVILTSGLGGYVLYGYNWPTYRLDLTANMMEKLGNKVDAISSSENLIAYTERSSTQNPIQIVVLNIATKERKAFSIPDEFNAAGDVYFSPNEQKIGLAASLNNPENEASNALVIDLENSIVTKLSEENIFGTIRVSGWKDNETFRWSEIE